MYIYIFEFFVTLLNSLFRSTKFWKRMKESNSEKEVGDAKRPPWRAVSVSTLPKPDKNALLRAKLLDASRFKNLIFSVN